MEISRAYARTRAGATVRFNFAGSNMLARQIVNGAPVDLFISADEAQMDLAAQAGAIDVKTRVPLLGNRLAIVTMPDGPAVDRCARRCCSRPSAASRLAIQRPFRRAATPAISRSVSGCGMRSRQSDAGLERAGCAGRGRERQRRRRHHIRIRRRDCSPGARCAGRHHRRAAPRIVYPAAIASAAPEPRRRRSALLTYLRGPAAAAVFARYKFVPLEPGA